MPRRYFNFCIECGLSTNNITQLFVHFKSIHNLVSFPCGICKFKSKNINQFWKHQVQEHDDIFPCNKCKFLGTSSDDLEKHMDACHIIPFEKVFQHDKTSAVQVCPYPTCDANSTDVPTLKRHYRKVHEGVALFCKFCGQKFTRGGKLKSHLERKHGTTNQEPKVKPETKITYEKKCGKCNFVTKYDKSLRTHLYSYHRIKKFKCDECDYECEYTKGDEIVTLRHKAEHLIKLSQGHTTKRMGNTVIVDDDENVEEDKAELLMKLYNNPPGHTMKRMGTTAIVADESVEADSNRDLSDDIGKRKLEVTQYPCLYCDNDFESVSRLKDHIQDQHKETLYFSELSNNPPV